MRPAAAGVVLGLALAVGAPTVWSLTQPPAAAGAPVQEILGTPSAPPASGGRESAQPVAPTAPVPAVPTRDAAPQPVTEVPAPTRVQIPALGVDAPVDPMGVAPDGQMALPDDVSRIGWYRYGPVPGADGSAVIAGHVDDQEQGPGALEPLRAAEIGAEVVVTDAAGTTTRWRVVSRELITKQVLPLEQIFTRSGPARLTLITCGGPFDPELRNYRDNVVVVAEPVDPAP